MGAVTLSGDGERDPDRERSGLNRHGILESRLFPASPLPSCSLPTSRQLLEGLPKHYTPHGGA
jgi:hypothetical protein